jgi:uncharacterized flavoprotein (TIGR03862 family)
MPPLPPIETQIAIVGGGPAGLMAAEVAIAAGCRVDLFEAKGSVGRKFLIAGKGGLNLTHGEARPTFDARYGERMAEIAHWLDAFDGEALRDWARGLGVETYVGTSGRVFPMDRKAAPLLRGWVRRLREQGVRFHVHHRWLGIDADGTLRFDTPEGERRVRAGASVLALGGASWPELGSDDAWVAPLAAHGIDIAPLRPSNCGFDIGWSALLAGKHAGAPLKPVIAHWQDDAGAPRSLQGECVLTATGIEGSLIYALSAMLRERIARDGETTLWLDLAPGRDETRLVRDLQAPRGKRSVGEHLRRQTGLDAGKAALVFETLPRDALGDAVRVAATIKRLPLRLKSPRPIAEAISSAGGVRLEALDEHLQLKALPGVFCAGEMLDWEAPTGGYLLTACFASGLIAGRGAVASIDTVS